jgi:glutamate formiminotransferase
VLEAVPNVSEGRNTSAISAIGSAFASRARLLDVHSDADHHRSVFTLVGPDEDLVESLVAGAARACELVDLRLHEGVHPRVGVVDVVPIVPVESRDLEGANSIALSVARRLGEELGLAVFLYGGVGEGRRPVFYRRGGLAELERRVSAGELAPSFGPPRLDLRSGAVLVGSRLPLVAYNIELGTTDVAAARSIAKAVRETGGGMAGVQAIGLELPRSGRVQVSMNILDLDHAPLHRVVERIREEAAARNVPVSGGELVGLVPEQALAAADAAGIVLPGIDGSRVLERLIASG